MVIYQKQPRVAHRQGCTVLQQNRLTRAPTPSPHAFSPSSWVSCVNIHYGIKTAFSSAWSGIHFRSLCFRREKSRKGESIWGRGARSGLLPKSENPVVGYLSSWGFPHPALAAFLPRGTSHADISWHAESCVSTHYHRPPPQPPPP